MLNIFPLISEKKARMYVLATFIQDYIRGPRHCSREGKKKSQPIPWVQPAARITNQDL